MPKKANNEIRKKVAHIIKYRQGDMVERVNRQSNLIAKAKKIDRLINTISIASIIGFRSPSKIFFILFISCPWLHHSLSS
jgi:hypothetical protein